MRGIQLSRNVAQATSYISYNYFTHIFENSGDIGLMATHELIAEWAIKFVSRYRNENWGAEPNYRNYEDTLSNFIDIQIEKLKL